MVDHKIIGANIKKKKFGEKAFTKEQIKELNVIVDDLVKLRGMNQLKFAQVLAYFNQRDRHIARYVIKKVSKRITDQKNSPV